MASSAARALLALFLAAGCALTADPAPAQSTRRPLPIGNLLLVGFRGTEVEGSEEIRSLVCDLKVGGLILFERDAATRAPRNIVSPEQVAKLTGDLQALARKCVGRPLLIAADARAAP